MKPVNENSSGLKHSPTFSFPTKPFVSPNNLIFQRYYLPLNWISSILNMTQHVSANGADRETPCKIIDVRNKYIVVHQQSKLSFKVCRPARVILVAVDINSISNFDLQIPEQNVDWEGRGLRTATPHGTFPLSVEPPSILFNVYYLVVILSSIPGHRTPNGPRFVSSPEFLDYTLSEWSTISICENMFNSISSLTCSQSSFVCIDDYART